MKKIVNVRIDARGIHGQVATTWVPGLNVNRLMVIDENAVKSQMQKSALKMATPTNVKLSVLSPKKAIERLNDKEAYEKENIMIILLNAKTLRTLNELGYTFEKVIVGNVPSRPDTKQIANTIYFDEEDIQIVKDLHSKGTSFIAQQVPNAPSENIMPIIEKN